MELKTLKTNPFMIQLIFIFFYVCIFHIYNHQSNVNIHFQTHHNSRGGGDLLRQLHDLAEVELELSNHQKRLSEIEAKVF